MDIVERLENLALIGTSYDDLPLLAEAAAEIVRLRADNERLRADNEWLRVDNRRLLAIVMRDRAAHER